MDREFSEENEMRIGAASRDNTRAPGDAKLVKQAGEAVIVWLLTYVTGVAILNTIGAEHMFVLALLPTLSTIFYNLGIFKRLLMRAGYNPVKKRD